MPARKEDAHRALELLEDYYAKLVVTKPQDQQLKQSVEQVIKIFKSSLFQALLDIHEFYEATLMDDSKSVQQKTKEAQLMSSKFQNQSPFLSSGGASSISTADGMDSPVPGSGSAISAAVNVLSRDPTFTSSATNSSLTKSHLRASTSDDSGTGAVDSQFYNVQSAGVGNSVTSSPAQNSTGSGSMSMGKMGAPRSMQNQQDISISHGPSQSGVGANSRSEGYSYAGEPGSLPKTTTGAKDHHNNLPETGPRRVSRITSEQYQEHEVILERGPSGLGFSISGGNDQPLYDDDPGIYISKILDGSVAQVDGRLKVGDLLTQINDDAVVDVEHQVAADALKKAGNIVQLRLKRLRSLPVRLAIDKGNRGLGISIAGGISNQHLPGDNGIFVTKIVEGGAAWLDGRLKAGDKIIAVGDTNLENCEHDFAVNTLKASGQLIILHIESPEPISPQNMARKESVARSLSSTTSLPLPSSPSVSIPPPSTFSSDERKANPNSKHANYSSASLVDSPYRDRERDVVQGGSGTPVKMRSRTPSRIERIESSDYGYTAPMASLEDENAENQKDPRSVVLSKGVNGLGFNIVGGEDGEGIFISHIVPGGSCDLSGKLRKGDRIISVNGINLRHATHEDAAEALKGAGQLVTIVARYSPQEYRQFEEKLNEVTDRMIGSTGSLRPSHKRTLYVRSLIDYDPSRDSGLPSRGLPFCHADILHVTNASDDEWWQAKRINVLGQEEGLGIIPSKLRVERKERARLKSVKFESNDTNKSASTSTLDRLTGRKKEKEKNNKKFTFFKGGKEQSGDDTSESEKPEESILSYEPVVFEKLKYVRPVIIMGPFKDRINDDLIAEYPDRFSSCVPHTTRPRREHEVNGRDYHFMDSREQMERDIQNHMFIEAGQYSDNLYGTSIAAVKEVADRGLHCILDVSGAAVRRLHSNNMFPIVVYVKPKSLDSLMEMNRRLTEDLAQKSMDRCGKLEKEFGHLFTATVTGDTPEEIYARVKEVIYRESGDKAWIPSKERL